MKKELNPKQIIRLEWWFKKLDCQEDSFIKFIILWFILNAWLTIISKKDRDRKALNWFYDNKSLLKDTATKILTQSYVIKTLEDLKKQSPIYDMRPGHKHESKELKNIKGIKEVLEFIYQIRCNLFHGSKSPGDSRDKNLVEFSSKILMPWLTEAFNLLKN